MFRGGGIIFPSPPTEATRRSSFDPTQCKMKAFVLLLLKFAVVSTAGQAGLELTEPYNEDDISFLGDNASRRSEKLETEHTIQLERPSDLSLEYLAEVFNTTPEEFALRSEVALIPRTKRVIFGTDERKKLPAASKAQKTPHSAACKVTCKGFCSWSCSGILIGSRHVLTSAHCLDDVSADTLQVGFLERNRRFQWYNVMKEYIPLRWKTSKALADDYAVLKLRRRPNRSYVSVSSVALSKNSVISITGFPGDKAPSSLWTAKCRPLKVSNGLIWNQCDAARGSSGSGVFVKKDSGGLPRTTVVGVFSGEKVLFSRTRMQRVRFNVAVYLTRSKVSQIHQWTQN